MGQKTIYFILVSMIFFCLFQCISYPIKGESVSNSIILIIDASSSMEEYNEDGTALKIDDAKKAAVSALDGLDNSTEVALIVFYDCDEIVLEQPFTTDPAYVKAKIENIWTDGYTPLAESIEMAISYMDNSSSGDEGVIIILTDGGETCKGDPVASANNVRMMVIDCRLHVINYGSDNAEQLVKISNAGKGRYYAPRDADELSENMKRVTNPVNWPYLDQGTEGSGPSHKEILSVITWYITLGLLLFAGFILIIFLFNYLFNVIRERSKNELDKWERKWWLISLWDRLKASLGGWSRKRRERRREARERKWAKREMLAEERRRERERKRAERERLAAERRRERERRRRERGREEICLFHPLRRSMTRKNDKLRRIAMEQRLARERRMAEAERLAKDREKEERGRQMAEERRRAEGERKVAENRKKKELMSRVSELAINDFGINPPDDLDKKIMKDPYGAEADVNAYMEMIETERVKRVGDREKKKIAREQKRTKARVMEKKRCCPSCGQGIRHVASYRRWYCDKCAKYLPKSFEQD